MSVTVEVRLDAKSMADFMVYHIFTGKAGILTLVLGGLNVGFAVTFISGGRFGLAGMFVAFAILVLAGIPYLIRKKVMNQVEASERLRAPIRYTFDEEGIETVTADDSGKAEWAHLRRPFPGRGSSSCMTESGTPLCFRWTSWETSTVRWWI